MLKLEQDLAAIKNKTQRKINYMRLELDRLVSELDERSK